MSLTDEEREALQRFNGTRLKEVEAELARLRKEYGKLLAERDKLHEDLVEEVKWRGEADTKVKRLREENVRLAHGWATQGREVARLREELGKALKLAREHSLELARLREQRDAAVDALVGRARHQYREALDELAESDPSKYGPIERRDFNP